MGAINNGIHFPSDDKLDRHEQIAIVANEFVIGGLYLITTSIILYFIYKIIIKPRNFVPLSVIFYTSAVLMVFCRFWQFITYAIVNLKTDIMIWESVPLSFTIMALYFRNVICLSQSSSMFRLAISIKELLIELKYGIVQERKTMGTKGCCRNANSRATIVVGVIFFVISLCICFESTIYINNTDDQDSNQINWQDFRDSILPLKYDTNLLACLQDSIILVNLFTSFAILAFSFKRYANEDDFAEQKKFIIKWFLMFTLVLTAVFIYHVVNTIQFKSDFIVFKSRLTRILLASWFTLIADFSILGPIFVLHYNENYYMFKYDQQESTVLSFETESKNSHKSQPLSNAAQNQHLSLPLLNSTKQHVSARRLSKRSDVVQDTETEGDNQTITDGDDEINITDEMLYKMYNDFSAGYGNFMMRLKSVASVQMLHKSEREQLRIDNMLREEEEFLLEV